MQTCTCMLLMTAECPGSVPQPALAPATCLCQQGFSGFRNQPAQLRPVTRIAIPHVVAIHQSSPAAPACCPANSAFLCARTLPGYHQSLQAALLQAEKVPSDRTGGPLSLGRLQGPRLKVAPLAAPTAAAATTMDAASAEQQQQRRQQQQQQQQKQAAPAKKKKSKAASVLSGSLSGALVSACVQPLDVIRTRMQADMAHGMVRSTLQTMQTIMGEVRRGNSTFIRLQAAVLWPADDSGVCCPAGAAQCAMEQPTAKLCHTCCYGCPHRAAGRGAHPVEGHPAHRDPVGPGGRPALLLP